MSKLRIPNKGNSLNNSIDNFIIIKRNRFNLGNPVLFNYLLNPE